MTIFAVLCLGAFARIPRLVHFVRTDEGRPTLSYAESVALCSARKYIGETWLHSELPPTGAEWMRVNETCGVVWREATPPRALPSGVALERAAHRADFLRLDLLLRHGGIYFDTDVVVFARIVNHIGSLLAEHDVVVGEQPSELSVYGEGFSETSGVCNAVLMAAPSSPFIQRFLEESIRHFTPGCWDCHSIKTLTRVVAAHRAGVTRVLLPAANAKDLDELPEQVKAELAIVLVRTLEEALPLALEPLSHKEPLEKAKESHEVAADEQQQQEKEQQQTGPKRGVLASRL